jgi:homoserine O-acetyltransferase
MVGLAFAAEYPDLVDRLVVISGAHRTHPMATAHRVVQRRIVELARGSGSVNDGLALSRALAMTTYRSIGEFEERFATPSTLVDEDHRFEVEEYLLAQGEKFCTRITADAFLCLSLSIDTHDIPPSSVCVSTDLISVDSDTLVPAWLMEELEEGLSGPCRHHRIDSIFGHDAFLKEVKAIGSRLTQILDRRAISL